MCVHIYVYMCEFQQSHWLNPYIWESKSFSMVKIPLFGTLSGEPAEDLPDLPDVPDLPATEDVAPVGVPTSARACWTNQWHHGCCQNIMGYHWVWVNTYRIL